MIANPQPDPDPIPTPTMANLDIDVGVQAGDWSAGLADGEGIAARAARAAFDRAAGALAPGDYEVSIVLADDATVQGLNRDWRDQDKPTNVLSFPALDEAFDGDGSTAGPRERLLGDVVVALETTMDEAARDAKAPGDHLAHLVVHGVLHLLGYDHENDADAEAMERLEVDILSGLGIADPYADGNSAPDA